MRSVTRTVAALGGTLALVGGAGSVAVLSSSASATTSAGPTEAMGLSLSGTSISRVDLSDYSVLRERDVRGLVGDTKLIGIDFRPADKQYYGVGDQGGVYTVNRGSVRVVKVSQLSVPLSGTSFGVDFNPAADRLRVVSDTGQNLRHDVAGGVTTVDGTLTYTPPAAATGITAAAYTNNDNDASTGTTLFDIDTALDQVVQQVPANNGTLVVSGKLGRDVGSVAGFDIYSARSKGKTVSNTGYAVLRSPGAALSSLYKVDLLSGSLTKIGTSTQNVADIAIPQR